MGIHRVPWASVDRGTSSQMFSQSSKGCRDDTNRVVHFHWEIKHRQHLPYTFRFSKTKQHPNSTRQFWQPPNSSEEQEGVLLRSNQPLGQASQWGFVALTLEKNTCLYIAYTGEKKHIFVTSKNYHQDEEKAHQLRTQVLLLQKIWVQFQELTWGPTTSCNSTPKASSSLHLLLHTLGANNTLRHMYA